MNIGIALSGCSLGAVGAYGALEELEKQGIEIGMLSACGLGAIPAMAYAYGLDRKAYHTAVTAFLSEAEENLDAAIEKLAEQIPVRGQRGRIPVAINAVNAPDGRIVAFSNDFSVGALRLETIPMTEDAYDALSGTISPKGGLSCYRLEDRRLCDFAMWYGCPVHLLRMLGMEKMISLGFFPQEPLTPYEALSKRMCEKTMALSELHRALYFSPVQGTLEEYAGLATSEMKSCITDIFGEMTH